MKNSEIKQFQKLAGILKEEEKFDTKFAAELKGFDPMNYMDRKLAQRTDPFTQYAIVASDMAIEDSEINLDNDNY